MKLVADELKEIEKKYGDERKTLIEDDTEDVTQLDLIPDEPMVVTISHAGYIKRVSTDTYRSQGRGGKGITAATFKSEDFIDHLFVGWAHSFILIFTNLGQCYWLRIYEIPEVGRTSKGKALINMVNLKPEEKVTAFVPVKSFDEEKFLVFATENGTINKMALSDFSRPRSNGIKAINLVDNDHLIKVMMATKAQDVMIASRMGQAIRFAMSKFRKTGRGTKGVKGITLADNDNVIGMVVIDDNHLILTVTEMGFAKRTQPIEYRLTGRGGKGVRNIRITDKNGPAVSLAAVENDQELMILTKNGVLIKMKVDSISILGRNTQGVRAIRVKPGDNVADVELIDVENVDSVTGSKEKAIETESPVIDSTEPLKEEELIDDSPDEEALPE